MDDELLKKIIGTKLGDISRICDLISVRLDFEEQNNIFLHIQSFFRILKEGKVIVCSEDIYKCGKDSADENFAWDTPGKSLFDESIKEHTNNLIGTCVIDCKKMDSGDCIISFEKDIVFQILINTVEFEEKYRVFNDNEEFIVNSPS